MLSDPLFLTFVISPIATSPNMPIYFLSNDANRRHLSVASPDLLLRVCHALELSSDALLVLCPRLADVDKTAHPPEPAEDGNILEGVLCGCRQQMCPGTMVGGRSE